MFVNKQFAAELWKVSLAIREYYGTQKQLEENSQYREVISFSQLAWIMISPTNPKYACPLFDLYLSKPVLHNPQ